MVPLHLQPLEIGGGDPAQFIAERSAPACSFHPYKLFNRVADYLEAHLDGHVTIEEVCRENLIGRSQLQKIFREQSGLGIIEYFSLMKVNAAKQLIRTNRMNFTQIAEQLGYTSIHYFSRQFKKVTGMTPSEYASSIKAMADGDFQP